MDADHELRAELRSLPPLHWRMSSEEAANMLARHSAIEQLIAVCQKSQSRADSKLRSRQNSINGITRQIDTYAARVSVAKQQTGYTPAALTAAIQQAQQTFNAVRRGYCEPRDVDADAGRGNGGLVEASEEYAIPDQGPPIPRDSKQDRFIQAYYGPAPSPGNR